MTNSVRLPKVDLAGSRGILFANRNSLHGHKFSPTTVPGLKVIWNLQPQKISTAPHLSNFTPTSLDGRFRHILINETQAGDFPYLP